MAETKEWTVTGNITLRGVIAIVEAENEEEARHIVERENADWLMQHGEISDWEVTDVQSSDFPPHPLLTP